MDILIGIYVCIMFQLLVFGIINLFQKRPQNRILGLFSFLILISASKIALWIPIQNTVFYFFFGGPHEFLIAPVLYCYLLSTVEQPTTSLKRHLVLPLVIYSLIHPLRLIVIGDEASHYAAVPYYSALTIFFILIYIVKAISLFKHHINSNLKKYNRLRFNIFYTSVNTYLIIKYLIILPLTINDVFFRNPVVTHINQELIFPIHLFMGRVVFLFLCLLFIYYCLTEINWIKKYFIGRSNLEVGSSRDTVALSKQEELKDLLSRREIYANKELNVNFFLQHYDIDRSTLKHFLSDHNYANFNEVINYMRINDFKEKIAARENLKFDLLSLAKESGFQSKASFYRVFKRMEGTTPTEYLKNNTPL